MRIISVLFHGRFHAADDRALFELSGGLPLSSPTQLGAEDGMTDGINFQIVGLSRKKSGLSQLRKALANRCRIMPSCGDQRDGPLIVNGIFETFPGRPLPMKIG
ncbi:MAG TPA: hypothetical protein DCS07_04090 [Bdellovibrionales bacterium]|nr:hypothetical protein [Bdellovibrionales bacterium]